MEISADYLFGKPVGKGAVRVVQEADRKWNWEDQKYDVDEKAVIEGMSDANGKFTAKFDLSAEQKALQDSEWHRYTDLHFAAYFTDASTNRTEQKRFDVRLTKEPIHIYLITQGYQNSRLPATVYVTTFYADGTPAVCDVGVRSGYEELAKFKTNSLGAGKIVVRVPKSQSGFENKPVRVIARDNKGHQGTLDESIELDREGDAIQLSTDKTIYKPGEPNKYRHPLNLAKGHCLCRRGERPICHR
jgi:hypothetical protein